MPTNNDRLPLASGDFNDNREKIKEFLKSQPELSDYDFDGSAISVLLDVLAYDNYQKAFYLNQIGNESFLSSAIKRNSIVSRAKDLGYSPRSKRASSFKFDLVLTAPSLTASAFLV